MRRTENGTFATGNRGGGRPKGSKNRATKDLRQFVDDFINNNRDKIQEDFDLLEPKERIDTIIKLMDYLLPKLKRTEINTGGNTEDLSKLTDEELDAKLADYGIDKLLLE